jgi:hypothetical protein
MENAAELLELYAALGWSLVPLKGKRAYLRDWPRRTFSPENVLEEINAGRADGIGIKTGPSSHLVAIDVDQPRILEYDPKPAIDRGALAHTTSRGPRVVFRSTNPEILALNAALGKGREELDASKLEYPEEDAGKDVITVIEIIGNGKPFAAPPSRHPRGIVYKWLTPLPTKADDILNIDSVEQLIELLDAVIGNKEFLRELVGLILERGEGGRRGRVDEGLLRAILGKMEGVKDHGRYVSLRCPFHPPDEHPSFAIYRDTGLAVDFHDSRVFTLKELAQSLGIVAEGSEGGRDRGGGGGLAARAIELALSRGKLFRDEIGDGYIHIKTSAGFATLKLRSRRFRQLLTYEIFRETGRVPSPEDINQAVAALEAKALFEGQEAELGLRVKRERDVIYYDLGGSDWRLVKITRDGFSVVENAEPRFRRFAHMREAAEPQGAEPREALRLLNFLNLPRAKEGLADEEVLVMVAVASCLIPGIPHPIIVLLGPPGSGKSVSSKLMRELIDPSATPLLSKPDSIREFVQELAHHYVAPYDNVSTLSDSEADILCRAVTGEGFVKRELYTDEEDVIFTFRRCVIINAIDLPSSRPDLLDRAILIEHPPLPPGTRRSEEDILREFEAARPRILGGLFAAISRALAIRPSVKLGVKPRLADFAEWGYAIAEALGIGGGRFLEAYMRNVGRQGEEAVRGSPVAEAVLELMRDMDLWEGTPSQLLAELEESVAQKLRINTKARSWPRAPNVLTRRLRELSGHLEGFGIHVELQRERDRRLIRLAKVSSQPSQPSRPLSGPVAAVPAQHPPAPRQPGDDRDGISGDEGGLRLGAAPEGDPLGSLPEELRRWARPYPLYDGSTGYVCSVCGCGPYREKGLREHVNALGWDPEEHARRYEEARRFEAELAKGLGRRVDGT